MVERFFRDLTRDRLRRGVFRDLEELILAIGTYIDRHNESPKPFIWTARVADNLEKSKAPAEPRRNVNLRDAPHQHSPGQLLDTRKSSLFSCYEGNATR